MIIWLAIFLIVIFVSFILAFFSMRDYQEVPDKKKAQSVFLIQNPTALTLEVINLLHHEVGEGILSLERLFKGSKSALVLFGPKPVLEKFGSLNLLELEDYTRVPVEKVTAWEVGTKEDGLEGFINPFTDVPALSSDEQFWWQITMQPKRPAQKFQTQIRAVFLSGDEKHKQEVLPKLQNLGNPTLTKVPKPLTSAQILEAYKLRSLPGMMQKALETTANEILVLLGRAG